MSKYIDADKAIEALDKHCDVVCQYSKKQRAVMCGACPLGNAFDVIDDFPAADVVEVTHGRWIDVEPAPHNLFYATCSVCGDRQTIEVANYCPMCGASMGRKSKCVECKGGYCEDECGAKMDEVTEERYCDRNICASNEVNGVSCDECEIAKYHNLEDDDSPCLDCEEDAK